MVTFDCLKTLEGHKGYVHALKASDNYLVSGSGDKTIKVTSSNFGTRISPYHRSGQQPIEPGRKVLASAAASGNAWACA